MASAYFGSRMDQRQVHRTSGIKSSRGVHMDELEATLERLAVPFEKSYLSRPAINGRPDHEADRSFLMEAIDAGYPVLLGVWADPHEKQHPEIWDFDHFVLLVGYDRRRQVFWVNDPLEKRQREIPWKQFQRLRENRRAAFYSLVLQGAS